MLSEIYEKDNPKQSLEYLKIAIDSKESLYDAEKVNAIQSITFNEEERQRTIESAKIMYRNKTRQYSLMSGIGIFLLLTLILYKNNRQKLKAKLKLKTHTVN
ncbi:MAG: hypothetical protein ABIN89_30185 [Chitinophagaceae bacterium]